MKEEKSSAWKTVNSVLYDVNYFNTVLRDLTEMQRRKNHDDILKMKKWQKNDKDS